ncbi:MAG: ankyrin repeat domain-containing protein, partial [Spirochaetota bacterium]
MQDGEFIPFDSPAWADDADGKAGFFDAAAAHRELHPAIKRYMEWSRRYHYDESGAGIFAALALVAHFPEEVDTAIDHIAELDLNHEVMEGEYIRRLVEHLGYNETTARLLAARATICCGQHGREDLEGYLETLDLKENAKLRTAFVEAAAAFEMRHALRMAEPFTADRERVLHFLDEGIEEWNDDPALEQAGPSELGEEIAVRARKLFEQHEFTEPLETESPAEMLGRLVGDWRAAQGEFAGGTASEQLLDAVGAAYADSSLRFPGNPTRDQLQKLVDEGADVDVGDPAGRTPLWLAARHDLIAATEFLIEQGAGLSSSCDGMTPLHKAVSYGHADIACRLAEAGADIDDAVWDAALDHLKEPEQNRLAEIAAKTGMACERAKAQAAIASGGLGGEERQALTAQAVQDPAA